MKSSAELLRINQTLAERWERTAPEDRRFLIAESRSSSPMEVPLHRHDHYELMFFQKGRVRFAVGSRSYHAVPGTVLIIGPEQPHQMIFSQAQPVYERYTVYLAPEYARQLSRMNGMEAPIDDLLRPGASLLSLTPSQEYLVQGLLSRLAEEQVSGDPYALPASDSILSLLLTELCRARAGPDAPEESGSVSPLTTAILAYLNAHYREPFTLDDLAAEYRVSKNAMMARFRQEIGLTIYQHLTRIRMDAASRLLLLGGNPTGIYEQCGYQDYASFYRAFCRVYGCGPREYLKQL